MLTWGKTLANAGGAEGGMMVVVVTPAGVSRSADWRGQGAGD